MKINLVPEVKQEQIRIRKVNMIVTTVATVTAIAFGVLIVVFLTYNLGRKAQISSIDTKTTKINQELEAYKDLEKTVISLETGLKEIKQVLNGGAKWSKFFVELEKVTPQDTQLNSFDISGQTITLDVTGKNVKSIDRFINSFSNYKVDGKNLFTEVSVTGYNKKDGESVSFSAKMNLVEGILW